MKNGKLFIRVVPQDRERGYMLLASWSKPVVQRTCDRMISLSTINQAELDNWSIKLKQEFCAAEVEDVTDSGLQRKLKKMFEVKEAIVVDTTTIV